MRENNKKKIKCNIKKKKLIEEFYCLDSKMNKNYSSDKLYIFFSYNHLIHISHTIIYNCFISILISLFDLIKRNGLDFGILRDSRNFRQLNPYLSKKLSFIK